MTKEEVVSKLTDASLALLNARESIWRVLREGRCHFSDDEADWLAYAVECAEDARHAMHREGGYDRIEREVCDG